MDKTYNTYEQVKINVLKSYFLIIILILIIISICIGIGYYLGDINSGIFYGIVVSVIVVPIQIFTAKAAILGMTKSKKADSSIDSHRRLISKVEGISISAGLKRIPDIYIIPTEVPNAFASGMSEKDAFIGVTQGLLDMLDDHELEGVIAHEISHIVHRDVMLSQLSVSLVSIILILSLILSRLAFFSGGRRSDDRDNNAGGIFALIGILALLIRPIAMLIANLIQLSISRKREYAADAYAVRLCGYSEGLARALEKIGKIKTYSPKQVESLGGSQLKCMYISFSEKSISSAFSTHPPIEKRIEIIRNMY